MKTKIKNKLNTVFDSEVFGKELQTPSIKLDTVAAIITPIPPYQINPDSPITELKANKIACNAQFGRDFALRRKHDRQAEKEVKRITKQKSADIPTAAKTAQAYEDQFDMNRECGEFCYKMKYWYYLKNDPEEYASRLMQCFKLFRGYEEPYCDSEFDPTINYWKVPSVRDKHDESYHKNDPSDCIQWRQLIDYFWDDLPNRYTHLFEDDFEFEKFFPLL